MLQQPIRFLKKKMFRQNCLHCLFWEVPSQFEAQTKSGQCKWVLLIFKAASSLELIPAERIWLKIFEPKFWVRSTREKFFLRSRPCYRKLKIGSNFRLERKKLDNSFLRICPLIKSGLLQLGHWSSAQRKVSIGKHVACVKSASFFVLIREWHPKNALLFGANNAAAHQRTDALIWSALCFPH